MDANAIQLFAAVGFPLFALVLCLHLRDEIRHSRER